MEVVGAVVVVVVCDGSFNQGVSSCVWCCSARIVLVLSRSDPLQHAVVVN